MSADAPHIHTVFFAPLLDCAKEVVADGRIEALLSDIGTSEAELRDPAGWVSSARAEAIVDGLISATGDPELMERASLRMFTGSYLGLLKPAMQFFGNLEALFTQFPRSALRWNKCGEWEIHSHGPGHVDLSYASTLEASRAMCRGRGAQLAALPILFGIPPAAVEHSECMHEGAPHCRYLVRWPVPAASRWPTVSGLVVGIGVGAAAAAALGTPLWGVALVGVCGGAAGWLAQRSLQLTERVAHLGERLVEQDRALHRSLEANEIRYEQLLDAKRGVEEQVDARTRQLRQAGEQLADALDEVRQLDDLKSRFFANVSHELRTPLQLILGPLDELSRDPGVPPAAKRSLAVLTHNATRLYRLTNQLLDLASADAGLLELRPAPVHLGDLLDTVARAFEEVAPQRRITLTTSADAGVACLDVHWLESSLTNLVANAIRHCDPGDRVDLRAQIDDTMLVLEVRDTGPGIPDEDLPRIFDRFAQSRQKEGAARGTGLGLAIVAEIAQQHGGRATVESVLGQGTTFRLTLPFVAAEAAEAITLPARPQVGLPHAGAPPVTVLEGPTPHAPLAVVAEDEPDLRAYVAATLADTFRVVACADGALAWEEVQRRLPDLVVTDWNMPRMSGIELCTAIRAQSTTARIPVILLTSNHTPDHVVAGYDAGADDYVVKPFHPRELMARAEAQQRLRRMGQEAVVRERMASIGMLSAEIAHHFRNPLNFIKSGLPVLRSKLDETWLAGHERFWSTLVESSGRIELLTRDLLRLARGHHSAEDALFNPGDSIRSAVRLVGATLPPDVALELVDVEDARLHGRSGDINQVLLNLLDNASRALARGGTIRVRAVHPTEDRYVITVEDSGPGVAPELRDHLFEAFVSTRAHGEGSGLGLAIASKVVEDHGGTIVIDTSSELGGACFRIDLPVAAEPVVA